MLKSQPTFALAVALATIAFMAGPPYATAESGVVSTNVANGDPIVSTTTPESTGSLPATGTSSSVLVVAGVMVALGAGAIVTALGTAATEGLRRSARPGQRNRRR